MLEVYGDLWTYPADARVITTNGYVRNDGAAVMGRGCAKQAKDRFPDIEFVLGDLLDRHGNRVFFLHGNQATGYLLSFPVKHHWREQADLALIEKSTHELLEWVDWQQVNQIVLPRPGCGNGALEWADAREIIRPILDDRFHVITWPT